MDTVKTTSSVLEVNVENPPFGSRFLSNESDVWNHNAWDHVPPPENQEEIIAGSLARQKAAPVPDDQRVKYNAKPAKYWDNFYKDNAANFFRDRRWLHNEFKELVSVTQPEAGPVKVVEIGCGAGNSVFPILSTNRNPSLSLHAYDYSSHAVKLVQNNPLYVSPPLGSIEASVWDLTSPDGLPPGLEPNSVDIAILVFVLSALHPSEWRRAVNNIYCMLKPGGLVVLRDYGRYDLTQLRLKSGRLLEDNFYIRGDKTRVYFFELDELALIFTGSKASPQDATMSTQIIEEQISAESDQDLPSVGMAPVSPSYLATPVPVHPVLPTPSKESPLFSIEQLGVDRRLIVNRKRQLKMYRVWMQGKFRKNR